MTNEEEAARYRQIARGSYPIGSEINPSWPLAYRNECIRMNAESQGETLPRTHTAGAELKKRKDRG